MRSANKCKQTIRATFFSNHQVHFGGFGLEPLSSARHERQPSHLWRWSSRSQHILPENQRSKARGFEALLKSYPTHQGSKVISSHSSLPYLQSKVSVYLLVVAAAGAYIDPWSPFKAAFVKASNLPPPLCGNFQPWKIGIQGGFGRIFSYVYYGILTGPRPYQLLIEYSDATPAATLVWPQFWSYSKLNWNNIKVRS